MKAIITHPPSSRIGIFTENIGKKGGGPETYETNLLQNLAKCETEHKFYVFCQDRDAVESLNITADNFTFVTLRPSNRIISYGLVLPFLLIKYKIELCHYTCIPSLYNPVPFVFTHHCFSTFNHKEFYTKRVLYKLNFLLKKGLFKSRYIICVSENVKRLTHEVFGIANEKMEVIHEGVDDTFRPSPSNIKNRPISTIKYPYFLYVGKINDRKNIQRILKGFRIFKDKYKTDHQFVIIGMRQDPISHLDKLIESLNLKNDVIELPHMTHEELPNWYAHSEAFVFPSLWEGFGLPVLEAFNCGTPVITSNLSSLPEIVGDAAILVDPYDERQIAEALQKVCFKIGLREQLITSGKERVKQFSWLKMAQKTLSIYEAALNKNGIKGGGCKA
jgi:glycosyltransferase involved in cell wall biosynthesis